MPIAIAINQVEARDVCLSDRLLIAQGYITSIAS